MTVTTVAGKFTVHLVMGEVAFQTATIAVTLHGSGFVPDRNVTEFLADAVDELPLTNGYAGAVDLVVAPITYDTSGHCAVVDVADVTWNPATFTCRYAVVHVATGAPATSPLVGWIDFETDQVADGQFVLMIDTRGLILVVGEAT